MRTSSTLTERYLAYYTPLVQEFVREVQPLPHPEIEEMPQPHLPLFGSGYELSSLRLVFIGQDTKGWGDLREFILAERRRPGTKLREEIEIFQRDPAQYGGNRRQTFWGFCKMMLAALYGKSEWSVLKNEILQSFAWAEVYAVELYSTTAKKLGVPHDYWEAISRAGERFNRFRHIASVLQPHAAIILSRLMKPNIYFEGCRYEVVGKKGRFTHFHLPEIGDGGVDVLHAPHPSGQYESH